MTGLDDGQRADFKLMAEVAKTTRTAPPERVSCRKNHRLRNFITEFFPFPRLQPYKNSVKD